MRLHEILTGCSEDASHGLLRECFHAMTPETIAFTRDPDGSYHFASPPPLKAILDVRALAFRWIAVDSGRGTVTIDIDGRHVIYHRVAVGPHEEWICHLDVSGPDAE